MSAFEEFQPKLGAPDNTKLGPAIHTWSISAAMTCPGATAACLSCCYAMRSFFVMNNVAKRHLDNWRFTETEEFVPWMLAALRSDGVRVLRVHCAGDFYDVGYTQKWVEIVRRAPHVRFFAYTRSWRDADIHLALRDLAALPNMSLWWSADVDSGEPPRIPGLAGIAWLARNREEEQATPPWATLVFRNNTDTLLKRVNGVQVCPHEIGLADHPKIKCTKCRICFRPKAVASVPARPKRRHKPRAAQK